MLSPKSHACLSEILYGMTVSGTLSNGKSLTTVGIPPSQEGSEGTAKEHNVRLLWEDEG